MTYKEAMMECGLIVRRGGRIARVSTAALLAELSEGIDGLVRRVAVYDAKIAGQRDEISRLKDGLEEAGRDGR